MATTPRKTLVKDPREAGINPLADAPVMKTTAVPTISTKSAEEVAKALGEGTVFATVQKSFVLTDENHQQHHYAAGVYAMPKSHAEHWFSKAHGVKIN